MHARRPFSPPTPAQPVASGSTNTKLVNKLVIRGSIGEHAASARVQIFAKISVPEFPPSQAYPLFREDSTRLIRSECHPLSSEGAPYALPPNVSSLMQRAVRALVLPPPLPVSYPDLLSPSPNASHYKVNGGQSLTSDMTGFITVNNYEYCYLSPRILVPPSRLRSQSAGSTYTHRRNSIGASVRDGILSFHIVAMELEVPLISTPPKVPYMLNVPLPRCLHNSIKFKIRLPSVLMRSALSNYSSATSNVSEEEQWSARTIPALFQRKRQQSTESMENWADQESKSDASSNSVNSVASRSSSQSDQKPRIIEGKFMSSDRIIIRWAPARAIHPALKLIRQDLSVERVESVLTCTIGRPIIDASKSTTYPVDLEFSAKCIGLFDPHVETELGLPIVIDTFSSTARWSPGYEPDEDRMPFEVEGGEGIGQCSWKNTKLPLPSVSLTSSSTKLRSKSKDHFESSPTPASKDGQSRSIASFSRIPTASNNVPRDKASLLRVPLPDSDSPATPLDPTFDDDDLDVDEISSVPDGYFSTGPSSRRSSVNSVLPDIMTKPRHPADPFKIHIDILPLLPNTLNSPPMSTHFRLKTKLLLSGCTLDPRHIALPAIRIPSAETHLSECIIRNKDKAVGVVISAPDADDSSKRSDVIVGGAKCPSTCQWTVEVSAKPWSENTASTSGDMWGDDCLLLVVPETKKKQGLSTKTLRNYSSRVLSSMRLSPTPSSSNGDESPGTLVGTVRPTIEPAPTFQDEVPASTIAATNTMAPTTPHTLTQKGPLDGRAAIAWVELSVSSVLSTHQDDGKTLRSWAHYVQLRAPFPSIAVLKPPSPDITPTLPLRRSLKDAFIDFGFSRSEVMAEIEVIAASVNGRRVLPAFYPCLDESPSPLKSKVNSNQVSDFPEYGMYIRIDAPRTVVTTSDILDLTYLVNGPMAGKAKAIDISDIHLPVFSTSVDRYSVSVENVHDHAVSITSSSLTLSSTTPIRLARYGLPPFFTPALALSLEPLPRPSILRIARYLFMILLPITLLAAVFLLATWQQAASLTRLSERVDHLYERSTALQLDAPNEPNKPAAEFQSITTVTIVEERTIIPVPSPLHLVQEGGQGNVFVSSISYYPAEWDFDDEFASTFSMRTRPTTTVHSLQTRKPNTSLAPLDYSYRFSLHRIIVQPIIDTINFLTSSKIAHILKESFLFLLHFPAGQQDF